MKKLDMEKIVENNNNPILTVYPKESKDKNKNRLFRKFDSFESKFSQNCKKMKKLDKEKTVENNNNPILTRINRLSQRI